MTLEETTELYASVLRQLLPVGGYDASPNTEVLAIDVYAHAKLLAQADLDAKRLLNVLEAIPPELINEYEAEYGLPLKCTVNASRTFEERLQILNWVHTSRNVLNLAYLEQLLAIFGVTLIDIQKFKPIRCTSSCIDPVNTEQLRYKVFLRLQYPMNADMSCIIENYLPGYLRIEWMIDMPWGNWILNPSVTVNTSGIAHYTAYKTNQREYYDSYANLDLTAAIVRSLHDTDMQQWQAVIDACNELTGVTDWNFDNNTSVVKYVSVIGDAPNPLFEYKVDDVDKICQTMRETAEVWLNRYRPGAIVGVQRIYDVNNGQTIAIRAGAGISSTYTWNNAPTDSKVGVVINRVNPMPIIDPVEVTYSQIAQKIISNASSPNQAISLLAEAYLEAVATSISNSDESKQFVKLSDLFSQFELNKTLRT